MPRRQTREIPRWRRGRTPQQPPQVIQLRGRDARALIRQMDAPQAGQAGKEPNRAAAANDMLARTGTWRFRRQFPPLAWGIALPVIGEILHKTHNPVLFGILGGLGAGALLIGFTRHLSAFGRRWSDVAAFLTAGWVPALAVAGFGAPAPAILAVMWAVCAGTWTRHYRFRPQEAEAVQEDTSSDTAIWARLAAKRKWSGSLTAREDIPGGRKYEIRLDGSETHIGDVLGMPRAIAAAWDKAQTEAYVEPHPTGVESRGILTILSGGTLRKVREWDGTGFDDDGIAHIGRFADGRPARIRAWVPLDGTRHGLVAGSMGSGKTGVLNLLLWLAVTSPVPIVPVILDPQNGQSLPQWQDKVLYAAGVEECARMMRGLHAAMMDRSRRLSAMTWNDGGHKAKGMEFFDTGLSGLPIVMPIIDEAPLLLTGGGNKKLAEEMVYLVAGDAKLGRKTGFSEWLVAQVPSLAELGGDQALRSMLVGGNVVCLRTGDKVSAGMLGLEADPSALPKYFGDGSPTQGLGYVVSVDDRQAPMRADLVPSRMRHRPVTVPRLEDDFLEAMDRAMGAQGVLLPSAPVAALEAAQEAEGSEGRQCADAVWQVLRARGGEMERGEIIAEASRLVTDGWGREKPFSIRAVGDALRDLASGKYPERPVVKPRDGVYEALAPRGGLPGTADAEQIN